MIRNALFALCLLFSLTMLAVIGPFAVQYLQLDAACAGGSGILVYLPDSPLAGTWVCERGDQDLFTVVR